MVQNRKGIFNLFKNINDLVIDNEKYNEIKGYGIFEKFNEFKGYGINNYDNELLFFKEKILNVTTNILHLKIKFASDVVLDNYEYFELIMKKNAKCYKYASERLRKIFKYA